MDAVEELLAQIPLNQLARQLGTDEQTAAQTARQAIPALIGGMAANADDPAGARSLAAAMNQHAASPLLDSGLELGQVDTDDGSAIVSNVFGDNTDAVVQTLGAQRGGGAGSGLVAKALPILAPIVLAYLSKRLAGGKYGDILGPILAGMAGRGGGSATGGLADILGQLLGGGSPDAPGPAAPAPSAPPASVPPAAAPPTQAGFPQPEPDEAAPQASDSPFNAPALPPETPVDPAPAPASPGPAPAPEPDRAGGGGLLGSLTDLLGKGRRH